MAASPSKFRSKIWDPLLITAQIVSMQVQFYSSLLIINYIFTRFVHAVYSKNYNGVANGGHVIYSLEQIFDHRLVNFHSSNNTFICFAFIVNSLISSVFEWKLINRSKQCLDFTCTVFGYHILFSWIYVGAFPASFTYWILIVICVTLMTVISEYLCMQSALKEIPLTLAPKTNL